MLMDCCCDINALWFAVADAEYENKLTVEAVAAGTFDEMSDQGCWSDHLCTV